MKFPKVLSDYFQCLDTFEKEKFHLEQFGQFLDDKQEGIPSKAVYFGQKKTNDLVEIVGDVYDLSPSETNKIWNEYSSISTTFNTVKSYVPDCLKLFYLGENKIHTNNPYYMDFVVLGGWSFHLLGMVAGLNMVLPYLTINSFTGIILSNLVGSAVRVAYLENSMKKSREEKLQNLLDDRSESLYSLPNYEHHD